MRLGLSPFRSAAPGLLGPPRLLRRPALTCRAVSTGQDGGVLLPGELGRPLVGIHEVQAQQQQLQQPQQQEGLPPRRRGRPPGHPAWNKGMPMPESTRKQLSVKLKQKWKDPEYRRSVTQAMLGRKAWNAGRPHEESARAKMSEAKLGKPKPLATRKRMSAAASGHSVSTEVRAEVGERFRGQPKSPEHRNKLAASARRRHAAARVLRAVEAVYAAASTTPAAPTPPAGVPAAPAAEAAPTTGTQPVSSSAAAQAVAAVPATPSSSSSSAGGNGAAGPNLGAVRAAVYSMGLTGLSDSRTGKRLNRTQILNTFKSELREYRALQEELSTWTAAFREKHNRKPNLVDVQRTGIPWLIERFKQYVVLRGRLFSDSSVLRGKLSESLPDPDAIRSANAGGPNRAGNPTNANGPGAGARAGAANRFAAALEYKSARKQVAAAPPAAAVAAMQGTGAAVEPQQLDGIGMDYPADPLAVKAVSSQAPPRVRLAMQAAMEYRQQKAQATKAAAETAAAAARAVGSTAGAPRAKAVSSSSSGMVGLAAREAGQAVEQAKDAPAAAAPHPAPAAVVQAEELANGLPSGDAGGIVAAAGGLG